MIPPTSSLVKYDNPVLVSRNTEKKSPRSRPLKSTAQQSEGATSPIPAPPKSGKLPPVSSDINKSQTEEILNAILPPREWTENGALWIQQVSSTPATRMDVINLQEELDMRLQQRQARETGICPVRRELYSQCFDELIRQVTINCNERGLLLLRVRDEIRMTIAAYQTLYESSVAFGMRKALQAEQGKTDMEKKIIDLGEEKHELEKQVNELKAKCDAIEKREAERRAIEEKKHAEEIQFLKRTNQQLKLNANHQSVLTSLVKTGNAINTGSVECESESNARTRRRSSVRSNTCPPVRSNTCPPVRSNTCPPVRSNTCPSVRRSSSATDETKFELEEYFQTVMSEFLSKIKTKEKVPDDEDDENGVDRSAGMISNSGLLKNYTEQDRRSEKQTSDEWLRNT